MDDLLSKTNINLTLVAKHSNYDIKEKYQFCQPKLLKVRIVQTTL